MIRFHSKSMLQTKCYRGFAWRKANLNYRNDSVRSWRGHTYALNDQEIAMKTESPVTWELAGNLGTDLSAAGWSSGEIIIQIQNSLRDMQSAFLLI